MGAVLSMVPSVSQVSGVLEGMARYFDWRELAILAEQGEEGTKIIDHLLKSTTDPVGEKAIFHRQFDVRDLKVSCGL